MPTVKRINQDRPSHVTTVHIYHGRTYGGNVLHITRWNRDKDGTFDSVTRRYADVTQASMARIADVLNIRLRAKLACAYLSSLGTSVFLT